MKFSFKNTKKNLIVVWSFSYILVISIMLVATLMISFIYDSTSQKNLAEFNDYIFKTASRDVKDTLLSMNQMYTNITSNPYIKSHSSRSLNSDDQEIPYDFINDLNFYEEFNENISDSFVYNKSTDTVISSNGVFPADLYYAMFFKTHTMPFDKWSDMIKSCDSRMKFVEMKFVDSSGHPIDAIAMLFSIPSVKNNLVGAVLSDKNNLLEGLEDINLNNVCDIYVYNSLGELVTYSKHSNAGVIPTNIKQLAQYQKQDASIHISNIDVNTHSWQVVTVVSDNAHKKSIVFAQTVIVCIILVTLIILFYAVKKSLNRNYQPIKTMLSLFNITETTNEYKHLFKSIDSALKQNSLLEKKLYTSSKKIKELTLAKLLRGELTISPQESYGFSFDGDNFVALAFYLDDISSLFQHEQNLTDVSRLSYLSFIIDNVMSEIMESLNIKVYSTEIDEQVVCLLNAEDVIDIEEVKSQAKHGRDFINENFDINLTFSLSANLVGVLNIPVAFSQAAEVLDHKRMLGIEEPMTYINNSSFESSNLFDLHKEQALINSIKTGNSQAALELLRNIFDEIEGQHSLPFEYIIYMILDIASAITRTANSILLEKINYNETMDFYKNIKNGKNLANIYLQMSEHIDELCKAIRIDISEGKNRTHFLVSHIEKYIVDNYADPNMCVYSIGTHFNIKPDYISKIFKKETGKPLLTYITHYRLEKALELIKNGKYSKKEIANMVGFASERNFYRVLKKYEEQKSNNEEDL